MEEAVTTCCSGICSAKHTLHGALPPDNWRSSDYPHWEIQRNPPIPESVRKWDKIQKKL